MTKGEYKSCTKQESKLLNLVYDAVDMENGRGVSRQKIIQRVQKACRRQKNVTKSAKIAIVKALETGMLVRTSGTGLNGSFRLSGDSNCGRVSVTSRLLVHEHLNSSKYGGRLSGDKPVESSTKDFNGCTIISGELTDKFRQLKAILKAPRSKKASGFHVKFSSRSPKVFWISPRPSKRQYTKRYDI